MWLRGLRIFSRFMDSECGVKQFDGLYIWLRRLGIFFRSLPSWCLVLSKREWSYRIRVIVLAEKKCFLGAISGGGRLSKTWFWTLRTTQHGSWRRQHELRRFGVHSIRLLGRGLLERVHFESFLCETFLCYNRIVVLLHIDCWQSSFCPVCEVVRLLSLFSRHL